MSVGARHARPGSEPHPSGDPRYKMLDATMKRLKFERSALIEVLHSAQELFGRLDADVMYYVARGLKLPPSRVYGAATFYHFFTFVPRGLHACTVCTGTACFVNGSDGLTAVVSEMTGIHPGETSADGQFSFQTARCLGSCGVAPVAVFDGEVCGKQTPETVRRRLAEWTKTHGPD